MKCGACTVDRDGYCACADFFGGRLAFWRGEYDGDRAPISDEREADDAEA